MIRPLCGVRGCVPTYRGSTQPRRYKNYQSTNLPILITAHTPSRGTMHRSSPATMHARMAYTRHMRNSTIHPRPHIFHKCANQLVPTLAYSRADWSLGRCSAAAGGRAVVQSFRAGDVLFCRLLGLVATPLGMRSAADLPTRCPPNILRKTDTRPCCRCPRSGHPAALQGSGAARTLGPSKRLGSAGAAGAADISSRAPR